VKVDKKWERIQQASVRSFICNNVIEEKIVPPCPQLIPDPQYGLFRAVIGEVRNSQILP